MMGYQLDFVALILLVTLFCVSKAFVVYRHASVEPVHLQHRNQHCLNMVCRLNDSDNCMLQGSRLLLNDNQNRRDCLIYIQALLTFAIGSVDKANAVAMSETTMKSCQSGTLMPEQAITGAYEQECMKLPIREIPYSMNGQQTAGTLKIRQGLAGAGTTGLAVWNSSVLLSRLLQELARYSNGWSSLKVLELGCGTGLASLTAAALGANRVLATDGNPAVVSLAEENIKENGLSERVHAQLLPWSFMNALDFADEMDLVIGSDLTYQSQNWPALAETMATIVKPRTGLVLYLTLGHAGFAVQAEMQGFLSVAQQYGLVPVTDSSSIGWPTADLTRLVYEKCIGSDEIPIVQSTGGVRVLLLQRKPGAWR